MAEFLALGLVEFAACLLLALAVVADGGVFSSALIVDLAGAIAAAMVGVSAVIGAYRGQAFMRRGGLLTRAVLAALSALIFAMLVVALRDKNHAPTDLACLQVCPHNNCCSP